MQKCSVSSFTVLEFQQRGPSKCPDADLCAKLMQLAEQEGIEEMEGLAALFSRVGQADQTFHKMLEMLAELVDDVGVSGPGSAHHAMRVLEDLNVLREAGDAWNHPKEVFGSEHAPVEQLLALARARTRRGVEDNAEVIRKLERVLTGGSR